MNKIYFLLKENQYQEKINLIEHFKKNIKGSGTISFANIFYFTLLEESLKNNNVSNWLEPPRHGLTGLKSVMDWLKLINCESLLKYASISTIRNVLVSFKKSGLIKIDERNKLFLKYPINNKMLSIEEAAEILAANEVDFGC